MKEIVGIVAFAMALLAVLAALTATPIWAISYSQDKALCASWGAAANRETKFVVLNEIVFPVRWDCFTPDEDGRWIPISRVRDID